MGKSTTPRYVVRMKTTGGINTPAKWNCKQSGRPNAKNLQKYIEDYETSLLPNGINEHLGVHSVISASIYDQYNHTTVVTCVPTNRPMFQIIEPLPEGHPFHRHTHGMKTLLELKNESSVS